MPETVVNKMAEKFIPSPTAVVKFVNKDGKVVKELQLNRRQRRKLGIKREKQK